LKTGWTADEGDKTVKTKVRVKVKINVKMKVKFNVKMKTKVNVDLKQVVGRMKQKRTGNTTPKGMAETNLNPFLPPILSLIRQAGHTRRTNG
jgi:hypothetical protein